MGDPFRFQGIDEEELGSLFEMGRDVRKSETSIARQLLAPMTV